MAKRPDKATVRKINIALPSADQEIKARKEAAKEPKNVVPDIPGGKWNKMKNWFELPEKLIHPDQEQPRKKFDRESIEDLKDDIEANGLINPIVVKNHPDKPGEYMIVNGGRRFLAFGLMDKKKTIPVILDNSADRHMQFRDNHHRENFTTEEVFGFITERLAVGESLDEVKNKSGMGKSSFTKYSTLLKEQNIGVKAALLDGRITSLEAAYSLSVLTKKYPLDVATLIESDGEITIKTIADFKEGLKQQERERSGATESEGGDELRPTYSVGENRAGTGGRDRYEEAIDPEGEEGAFAAPPQTPDIQDSDSGHAESDDDASSRPTRKKVVIKAKYEGKQVTILAKMPEKSKSHLWIRTKAGDELEVKGDELTQPRAAEE